MPCGLSLDSTPTMRIKKKLILREDYTLRVFSNRILKKIFGSTREK
jgi:ATP-dependent Clp protease adapter protein ClpS